MEDTEKILKAIEGLRTELAQFKSDIKGEVKHYQQVNGKLLDLAIGKKGTIVAVL